MYLSFQSEFEPFLAISSTLKKVSVFLFVIVKLIFFVFLYLKINIKSYVPLDG